MKKCKETTYNQFISEINSRLGRAKFVGRPIDALDGAKDDINSLLKPYGLRTGEHWADYNVTMTPENPFKKVYGVYSAKVFRLKVCGEQDMRYRDTTVMLAGAYFELEPVHEPNSIGFDPATGSMHSYYKNISLDTLNVRINTARATIDELKGELKEARQEAKTLNEELSKLEEL